MSSEFIRDSQVLVGLTNEILSQLHVSSRVRKVDDIGATVFVTMYEGLCGEVLPDVVKHVKSREDEVHNCQAVIDSLSMDVLNTSLSHISGDDVISGDRFAIGSLLDVFSGLLEFMLDKIGSDTSSVVADPSDVKLGDLDDPDLVTAQVIDDILERELGNKYKARSRDCSTAESRNDGRQLTSDTGDSTAELIKLGHSSREASLVEGTLDQAAMGDSVGRYPASSVRSLATGPLDGGHNNDTYSCSPGVHPAPASSCTRSTDASGNSTADLIRESEELQRQYNLLYPNAGSSVLNGLSTRPHTATSFTHPPHSPASAPSDPVSCRPASVPLDSSVASSVSLPQTSPHSTAGAFSSLGQGARHDRLAASLPVTQTHDKSTGSSQPHVTYEGHIHLYHHDVANKTAAASSLDPLSASLPATMSRDEQRSRKTHSGSSGARADTSRRPLQGEAELPTRSGMDSSSQKQSNVNSGQYDTLQSLMRDTVAMSRAAVQSSPLRDTGVSRVRPSTLNTDEELSEALRSSLDRVTLSDRVNGGDHRVGKTLSSVNGRPKSTSTGSVRCTDGDLSGSGTVPKSILSPPRRTHCTNGTKQKAVTFKPKSSEKKRSPNTSTDSSHAGVHSGSKTKPSFRSRPADTCRPTRTNGQNKHPKSKARPAKRDTSPQTFRDYIRKYYGNQHPRLQSVSDEEIDYRRSESETSGAEADVSSNLEKQLIDWHDQLRRRARTTRFDDLLDNSTPGKIGNLRRQFKAEDQKTRLRQEFLRQVYDGDFQDLEEEAYESMAKDRQKASDKEREYKKKVLSAPKTSKYKPAKKYTGTVKNSKRGRPKSSVVQARKRSVSASPSVGRRRPVIKGDDLLPWLLEEFPYLHLTTETLHNMWKTGARQVECMSKVEQEVRRKKSKQQVQVEEAERRQEVLMNIMKKELAHTRRKRDVEERRQQQQQVKAAVRDKRLQTARCRKYYDEFQIRNRSKMLKKRSREEVIFKNLFKEGVNIQKDRIQELRSYAKEERERRAKKQQEEISGLENYYKDQFSLLVESMVRERQDMNLRESAQSKVLEQMKRELRQKMENEIRSVQDQLWRDEDDAHYRTLDAERLKQDLHRASLQVKL